jgi:hypothetical protein
MNEGVPPPSSRAFASPQVVRAPDGSVAWVVTDAGALGISFGLIELDDSKIGLQVNDITAGSQASIVPGLVTGMVLQQIDEFHIRKWPTLPPVVYCLAVLCNSASLLTACVRRS